MISLLRVLSVNLFRDVRTKHPSEEVLTLSTSCPYGAISRAPKLHTALFGMVSRKEEERPQVLSILGQFCLLAHILQIAHQNP